MNLRLLALGILVCLSLQSCTLVRIYSTSGNSVSMTNQKETSGEVFKIEHRVMFDYTGAIDLQELLRDRYGSGHVFENVSIKIKTEVPDFLINLVTLGLAQSKTFEISGDKVK